MLNYIAVIICAAGLSKRMGGVKKEFLPLESNPSGKENLTVLGAAVKAFASSARVGPIIITLPPETTNGEEYLPLELRPGRDSRIFFCSGGKSRRSSVHKALLFLESLENLGRSFTVSHVLIHDGARPWVNKTLIEHVIDAAITHNAVIPALPLLETPKEVVGELSKSLAGETVFIKKHLKRAALCTAQTPQGFAFPQILRVQEKAEARERAENFEYTDDAEVWGEFVGPVAVIPGHPENKKITFPEDIF